MIEEELAMNSEEFENAESEIDPKEKNLAKANELCAEAESLFRDGKISLKELYDIYDDVCRNLIPDDADVDYGPWAHIFWRRRRLRRLLSGKHKRKNWGEWSGGKSGVRVWDACDFMDLARDDLALMSLEADEGERNQLLNLANYWKKYAHDVAKRSAKNELIPIGRLSRNLHDPIDIDYVREELERTK